MTSRLADAVELVVPKLGDEPILPSLGGFVCDFIEGRLVHGPGDVRGGRSCHGEYRLAIWRMYEVYPPKHSQAGRRRFKRAAIFRRKGLAKTELLACVAIAEFDPTAPVRCTSWRKATSDDVAEGYQPSELVPVGGPVRDPFIPLLATTEDQSEELAYGTAKAILENCELGNAYDVGEERIRHRQAPGELKAVAGAPGARDGGRTTFNGFDETHLYLAQRLLKAHATMLRNTAKRKIADAWSLEVSTMYEPGENSVAEATHAYALDIAEGRIADHALYFDHRQAALVHDLSRRRELVRAIEEASGDGIDFADVAAIANEYLDPTKDRQAFRRYFLNQRVKGASRWIAPEVVEPLVVKRRRTVKAETPIVLAFDGSYNRDSTALVGCTIAARPHVFVVAAWERPRSAPLGSWRTPRGEVLEEVRAAMGRYDVRELAPDPPGWHREIEELEDEFGEVVVRFETSQPSRMGPAASTFLEDAKEGAFSLEDSEPLRRHLANCVSVERRGFVMPTKAARDSADKIDVAVGAVVAYARARHHHLHPPTRRLSWKVV